MREVTMGSDGGRLPRTGISAFLLAGTFATFALLGGLVFWAAETRIDSAVASSGQVVVRGKPKVVQSLEGGVVEEIFVHNGDEVVQGQILIRLDPTLVRVNLDIARHRLAEALALKARLEAEDLSSDELVFAYDPLPLDIPLLHEQEEGQRRVFRARKELEAGRRAQLAERLAQFERQIEGLNATIAAKEEQLLYLERELASNRQLLDQGLVRESQVLSLQRARADMKGSLGEAAAERSRIGNAMQDAEIEVDQAEREFREQVVTDLRSTQKDIEELTLQIVTLSRQFEQMEIRAPASGVVHEMQVTTLGGVVTPNGTILQIIPLAEGVEFELLLDPHEIDRVYPGQSAQILFTAFDQRSTPKLAGQVTSISPTAVIAPIQGGGERSFYRVGLALGQGEVDRLRHDVRIVPGMPVEAYLETGEHTVLSYLVQPLKSQIERTFREH